MQRMIRCHLPYFSLLSGTPLLESVGLHEPFVESLRDTLKRAIQQVSVLGLTKKDAFIPSVGLSVGDA